MNQLKKIFVKEIKIGKFIVENQPVNIGIQNLLNQDETNRKI
jgi:hypothetical protein